MENSIDGLEDKAEKSPSKYSEKTEIVNRGEKTTSRMLFACSQP